MILCTNSRQKGNVPTPRSAKLIAQKGRRL